MTDDEWTRCLAPIQADAPVGAEVRQTPAYEALRAEIDKLDDPRAESPDWGRVELQGIALLSACGKDLLVACYVAWARYERSGVRGLVEGLGLVHGLIAAYGLTMHPPRERARGQALAWLSARLENVVVASDGVSDDDRIALAAVLTNLQTVTDKLLGERAPSFKVVTKDVARSAAGEGMIVGPPQDVAAKAATGRPERDDELPSPRAADARGDLTFSLESQAERRFCLVRTAQWLRALAGRCLEDDLADPRAYRLLRIAGSILWDDLPPANERGRTELVPPSGRRLRELSKAREAGAFRDVVTISEELVGQQPLWLDGHWITAQALTSLGAGYDAARNVVAREGRALFARFSGLSRLTFADGSPLGSADACAFLAPRDPSASGANERALAAGRADGAGRKAEALIAQVVADEGDARKMFERAVRASRSPRRAFQLRLALAQKLEAAGQAASAARIYAGLERDLDAFRIDLWDPELARSVVLGLSRTLPALDPRGANVRDRARVTARVAQLAPTTCL